MKRTTRAIALSAFLAALPLPARAGWVAQWVNTAFKTNGDRLDPQNATMRIAKGKVRLEQPNAISLIDYDHQTFTILNPQRQYFWTGSLDEYVKEMTKNRDAAFKRQLGGDKKAKAATGSGKLKVEPGALPKIAIEKTAETKTIAGHETTKYVVKADDEPFQEIWVAPNLGVSRDLDLTKYFEFEGKMSGSMIGKSGKIFFALYRDEEYRKLLANGFPLQTVTHHIAGGYEQLATEFKEGDVPASEFEVPDSYRRVRLADVFAESQKG